MTVPVAAYKLYMCVVMCFVCPDLKHRKNFVEICQFVFCTDRSHRYTVWELLNHVYNIGVTFHGQHKLTNHTVGFRKIGDDENTIQFSLVFSYFLYRGTVYLRHTKTTTDLYINYTLLGHAYVTSGIRLTSPWFRLKSSFS